MKCFKFKILCLFTLCLIVSVNISYANPKGILVTTSFIKKYL